MVNKYKSKFTLLQQEILRFLFIRAGQNFNARRVAQKLGKTQAGIAKALPGLEKEEFVLVKKDKESGRLDISLNRDNDEVIRLKRAENLIMIYESGLFDFLESRFPGSSIILFGSYSRGEDLYSVSDIDIAIIGSKHKPTNLSEFEEFLERKISLSFYEGLEKINVDLRNNILRGILLSGGL